MAGVLWIYIPHFKDNTYVLVLALLIGGATGGFIGANLSLILNKALITDEKLATSMQFARGSQMNDRFANRVVFSYMEWFYGISRKAPKRHRKT